MVNYTLFSADIDIRCIYTSIPIPTLHLTKQMLIIY